MSGAVLLDRLNVTHLLVAASTRIALPDDLTGVLNSVAEASESFGQLA